MDVDHRGFLHRRVWPSHELTFHDRVQIIIASPFFAAVIAAIVHHYFGIPNVPFFIAAIVGVAGKAYFMRVRRDGIYDRDAEIELANELFPRLLYIVVTLLLPRLKYLSSLVLFLLRVRPEELRPSKEFVGITIAVFTFLYWDGTSGFRCIKILGNGLDSVRKAVGNVPTVLARVSEASVSAAGWLLQTKVVEMVRDNHITRHLRSTLFKPLPPYRYSPLEPGMIRLLTVERRLPFMDVRTSLLHVKLANKPIYEAISYTWGTSTTSKDIIIDGHSFITSVSTYNAIHGRSSLWRRRVLWIDALCINQQDPIEKGHQVSLMTEIYQNASLVVVWLASDSRLIFGMAYLAIALLHELGHAPRHVDLYRRYERHTLSINWRALLELFNNPWFTRVWIVQEVAVATEVTFIYGGFSFTWEAISAGIEVFNDSEMSGLIQITESGKSAMRNINHFREIAKIRQFYKLNIIMRQSLASSRRFSPMLNAFATSDQRDQMRTATEWMERGLKRLSLAMLLTGCASFDSTRRRDKVFAFTGLAVDEPHPAFVPNYIDEVTVEEIYTKVARYFLESNDPFSVIGHAGIGSPRNLNDLPSWASDWTTEPQGAPFTKPGYFDEFNESRFSASRKEDAQIAFGLARNDLFVRGFLVDDITSLGPVLETKFEDKNFIIDAAGNIFDPVEWDTTSSFYHTSLQLGLTHARKYGDKESIHEAFWRTLIGDQTTTTRPAPATLHRDYLNWVSMIKENDQILKEYRAGERDRLPVHEGYWIRKQDVATWGTALGGCISGRRIAITKDGYLAVVPPCSEVGDKVAIVLGARTPWLLRQINEIEAGEERPAYKFVGECYVHGMMSGEMMDEGFEVSQLLIT